jgi:hypothetical protein
LPARVALEAAIPHEIALLDLLNDQAPQRAQLKQQGSFEAVAFS